MNYIIENKYRVISEQGSKGQQEKYYRNGYWYKFDKNDIRIEKFPYGAHYYAYVGDVQVKDGTTLKWNTYEEARRQAEKYVRN